MQGNIFAPCWAAFAVSILIGWAGYASATPLTPYRSFDGTDTNPNGGAAETPLIRLVDPAYDDGANEPRTTGTSGPLANPREISNTVAAQSAATPNAAGASNWLWQWGQFIDHDLARSDGSGASPAEDFQPIPVPQDNATDPFVASGITALPFTRVPAAPGTGTDAGNPRQQINEITSFLDGSVIYGSSAEVADALRAPDAIAGPAAEMGRLRTQDATFMTTTGLRTETLLPFADGGPVEMANPFGLPTDTLFGAGEPRANEQIGLTATHTLFVREHNRVAAEIGGRLDAGDTVLADHLATALTTADNGIDTVGDFVFRAAREVVTAEIQAITYNEFLPILIGDGFTPDARVGDSLGGGFGLTPYTGFDDTVDPSISHEFANAAYRLGHTLLSDTLDRQNADGTSPGAMSLASSFFNAGAIFDAASGIGEGVDSLLLGLALGPAQALDNQLVDGVRNLLFPAATGGLDLASVNIARGRDVGLAPYNAVREALGLGAVDDYLTIAGMQLGITEDPELAALLELACGTGNVDDVDLWVGGLAEDAVNGGLLGETFNLIVSDAFRRLRDGDPYFYLGNLEFLGELGFWPGSESTLSAIIARNTGITGLQGSVFLLPAAVPEPGTLTVTLAAMALLAAGRRRRPS